MKKTVYVCDLCGKEYSEGNHVCNDGSLAVYADGLLGSDMLYLKAWASRIGGKHAVELCQDCQLRIAEKFVRELKKESKQQAD